MHGCEQAPKGFNLIIVILLIWHEIMMSEVVKRFTVCFVPKSQHVTMTKSALNLWELCPLRIGYSHSTMTNDERMQQESSLIATIRKKLPDFVKACADDTGLVLLHQDAFAADYQEDEYTLPGMAIKYAGLRGKEVRMIGKNRSTLGEEELLLFQTPHDSEWVATFAWADEPALFHRLDDAVARRTATEQQPWMGTSATRAKWCRSSECTD